MMFSKHMCILFSIDLEFMFDNIDEHFWKFLHRVGTRFMYHLSKSERKTYTD